MSSVKKNCFFFVKKVILNFTNQKSIQMEIVKKNFIVGLLLLGSFQVLAQTSHINIGAYTNNSGRNVIINFGWNLESSSIDFGVKYLFRNAPYDSAGHLYYRRYYPESFVEHLGLNFMFRYYFHLPKIDNNFFVFTNLQSTRAGIRNKHFWVDQNCNCSGATSVVAVDSHFENVYQLENNTGVGFRAKISEKLTMHLGGGAGMALIFHDGVNAPNVITGNRWGQAWEFSGQAFAGLEYRIR